MKRKIKMGMIGGGSGSFIGAVHRMAANLDGLIELCCGSFSSSPEKSLETGKSLFLPVNRIYPSYEILFEKESELPESEKMDFISIVTPNHVHFDPAMLALNYGFHVVLDKPITLTLDQALHLQERVSQSGKLFCLTHTYSGYPLVKEARYRIASGDLGKIRKIYVEYPQGWLSGKVENTGNKQADWRMDPMRSGKSGCMGDIGTHAAHLAEYITGLKISEVAASLNHVGEGRILDDDGEILLRFSNGASGILVASQVATGEENALTIRIYGEKGGLSWSQMEPNSLILRWADKPVEIYRTGGAGLSEVAKLHTRLPAGHPEGYLEAFANLYRNFALDISSRLDHSLVNPLLDYPGTEEGVRGMNFIDKILESSNSNSKWINI